MSTYVSPGVVDDPPISHKVIFRCDYFLILDPAVTAKSKAESAYQPASCK